MGRVSGNGLLKQCTQGVYDVKEYTNTVAVDLFYCHKGKKPKLRDVDGTERVLDKIWATGEVETVFGVNPKVTVRVWAKRLIVWQYYKNGIRNVAGINISEEEFEERVLNWEKRGFN